MGVFYTIFFFLQKDLKLIGLLTKSNLSHSAHTETALSLVSHELGTRC